jgi:hypothetical protein
MLTPHQLARLFVIVDAPKAADAAGPEIEALVEQDLVQCVAGAGEAVELRVTPRGAQVLARLARPTLAPSNFARRAR